MAEDDSTEALRSHLTGVGTAAEYGDLVLCICDAGIELHAVGLHPSLYSRKSTGTGYGNLHQQITRMIPVGENVSASFMASVRLSEPADTMRSNIESWPVTREDNSLSRLTSGTEINT